MMLEREVYVEVRNNVDVGCASIWRKQRDWEGMNRWEAENQ